MNNPYANFAGMVIISGGIVRNLTIGSGSYFRTRYTCGSVVSANNGGQVINCHSAATIEAIVPSVASWIDSSYGGVVANNRGDNGDSYVVGCSFSGKITADLQSRGQKTFLGGVVGSSWTTGNGNDVQVIGCLSSGEVTLKNSPASAQTHVGGIVGSCYKNQSVGHVCVLVGWKHRGHLAESLPQHHLLVGVGGKWHRHRLGNRH